MGKAAKDKRREKRMRDRGASGEDEEEEEEADGYVLVAKTGKVQPAKASEPRASKRQPAASAAASSARKRPSPPAATDGDDDDDGSQQGSDSENSDGSDDETDDDDDDSDASDADTDDDAESDEDGDAGSDEDIRLDQVLANHTDELQIDFEFYDPRPDDFHGTRALLSQSDLLDAAPVDVSELADMLTEQASVGPSRSAPPACHQAAPRPID
jgi:hypothetical protein